LAAQLSLFVGIGFHVSYIRTGLVSKAGIKNKFPAGFR
jgi:hypothetical protein